MVIKKTGFIIFLIICCIIYLYSDNTKNIIIMPFQNNGNFSNDKICDYISLYLILLFNALPDYHVIPLSEFKAYCSSKTIEQYDLKKDKIIKQIFDDFNSNIIIGGFFNDEDESLLITYKIYQYNSGELNLKEKSMSVPISGYDTVTLNENFDQLKRIYEEITNTNHQTGILYVETDWPCNLSIDDIECGETSCRYCLSVGEHHVKLYYKSDIGIEYLMNESIIIKPGEQVTYNINVLRPISITADRDCIVYINGESQGITPFHSMLYAYKSYSIKVEYTNTAGETFFVYQNYLPRFQSFEPVYLNINCTLIIDYPPSFNASINNGSINDLPALFGDLEPGKNHIRIFLNDQYKKWDFYDTTLSLAPGENHILKFDDGQNITNWNKALLFVPSAAQFKNHEQVKGTVVLSLFVGSVLISGISAGLRCYYQQKLQTNPQNSDSTAMMFTHNILIGGLVSTGVIYLYSLIDGLLTAKHINYLIKK